MDRTGKGKNDRDKELKRLEGELKEKKLLLEKIDAALRMQGNSLEGFLEKIRVGGIEEGSAEEEPALGKNATFEGEKEEEECKDNTSTLPAETSRTPTGIRETEKTRAPLEGALPCATAPAVPEEGDATAAEQREPPGREAQWDRAGEAAAADFSAATGPEEGAATATAHPPPGTPDKEVARPGEPISDVSGDAAPEESSVTQAAHHAPAAGGDTSKMDGATDEGTLAVTDTAAAGEDIAERWEEERSAIAEQTAPAAASEKQNPLELQKELGEVEED